MRWRLLSDTHCCGWPFKYEHQGEDVVLLLGDIHTRNRHEELISQIPPTVKILFVSGNHEHYHSVFEDVNKFFKQLEKKYKNFTFLNNTSTTIGEVAIYGGTMWSDLLLYGYDQFPYVKQDVSRGIADFYRIHKKPTPRSKKTRLWTIDDHLMEHKKFVDGLQHWLRESEGKTRMVLSHFCPTKLGIAPQFRDSAINPYFTCDMERFFGLIDVFCYGHTHSNMDQVVDGTRVISNQKGYNTENPGFNPNFMFEL